MRPSVRLWLTLETTDMVASSSHAHQVNPREIATFLQAVYGQKDASHVLCVWRLPDKRSKCFTDLATAQTYLAAIATTHDCYVQVALLAHAGPPRTRGTGNQVIGIPGLWAD